jgi:outer membrane biosynthesis protein TonB
MSIARMSRWSLRPEQAEVSRLAWAFAISLALHLLVYGGYHTGQKLHLWQNLHWPAWLHAPKILQEAFKKKETQPPPPQRQDIPLIFVNVNPAQATADAPKDAKYYSDKNSRAANPEPDRITETPKIDGKQTEVVKTEEIPREKFAPLQPSRPAQQPQEPQTEIKPKPAYTPGDLTLAKPSPTPRKTEGDANEVKPPRPRTVREALARQQDSRLPGEKMKQDGGVQRRHEMASLDTKATPFGAYDAALVDAISQRWFTLLDEREYAADSRGKVVLQFRLHYDGRITDMKVAESTAGEVLSLVCQKAVLDPAPFAAWPSDMRRTLGDTRNIQFTFYYY